MAHNLITSILTRAEACRCCRGQAQDSHHSQEGGDAQDRKTGRSQEGRYHQEDRCQAQGQHLDEAQEQGRCPGCRKSCLWRVSLVDQASSLSAQAPAVVDTPKVLSKTKSGRVTKTNAAAPSTKKTATKKATPKKAAAKA